MGYLFVFLGGGVGAVLRHAVNLSFARWIGTGFPFYTLFENVSGSIIMGVLAGYFALVGNAPQEVRLFLTTGLLGGYTTFSAFSLDFALLWDRGQPILALVYILASVGASLAGLMVALHIVRHLA